MFKKLFFNQKVGAGADQKFDSGSSQKGLARAGPGLRTTGEYFPYNYYIKLSFYFIDLIEQNVNCFAPILQLHLTFNFVRTVYRAKRNLVESPICVFSRCVLLTCAVVL